MVSPASDLARSSGDFVPAIAAKLAAGLLPGDAVFSDAALAEASRFVLAAAQRRSGSEAAIALESVPGPVGERLMRIAAINDDMPFLVDSVAAAIAAQGIVINRLVHPVIPVRRNAEGVLTDLPEGDAAGEKRESMIYIETGRVDARSRRQLSDALGVALADVQAAVTDWPAMQAAMAADADRLPDAEGAALLRWFKDGMLTQDEINRAADLGLAVSTHTNRYIYKEGHLLKQRLGAERENEISPLRSLVDAGVKLSLGTDNVPVSMFYPIWQAVARKSLYTGEVIAPEQKLSREQALRAATVDSAWLTFEEDKKGSIETGKFADLAVLSADPLTVEEDGLKDISSELTVVGGKIVWGNGEAG